MVSSDELIVFKKSFEHHSTRVDPLISGLAIMGLKCIDTIEAQQQEIDKLTNMWDEASNSLVEQVSESEHLKDMLKRLEWSWLTTGPNEDGSCPDCGNSKEEWCKEGCELAEMLKEVEQDENI
jgi:hypothetical protein